MCEVCKATTDGVVGRVAARRAQAKHDQQVREEAIRSVLGQPAPPRLTATGYAQRCLAVVGGIVLLASVNLILHVLVITLAVLFAAVSCSAAVVTVRRRRKRRPVIPAPLPAGPVRTVVTAVTVQAIGQAGRSALTARERAESQVRR